MGIDGIGKGGPKLPANLPTGEATKTGRDFEVSRGSAGTNVPRTEKAEHAQAAGGVEGARVSPLDKLKAGQIDLNGYLDLKVDQATAQLKGLAPADLESIKKMLRDQLSTDPTLKDLVKNATGASPPVPPED